MRGLINNQWDRDNLEFLLNTKGDDFKDWYAQSDEEDKAYAQELMDAYSRELQLKAQDLEIEAKLGMLHEYNEANAVIDKIIKS